MLTLALSLLTFSAEISPLRKLALSQANAAANSIVETNYLLDPNGICVDCSPAQKAAMKKSLLPPTARAAIARARLWGANKVLNFDERPILSNPLVERFMIAPRLYAALVLTILYVGLPLLGLGPWIDVAPGRFTLRRFLIFFNLEILWN